MTLLSISPSLARRWRSALMALPLVTVLIVPAGCGAGRPVGIAPTDGSTPTAATRETVTPTSPATPAPTATALSSGQLAMTLTDVRTGETFTLAQFAGKVTIVQHMAVW